MPPLSQLIATDDRRLRLVRDGEVGEGPVLLWVQRAQRAAGNHAANLAIGLANDLERPVVAAFCLVPGYPRATLRAYHFMAEGLRELPDGFAARGVGWILRSGEPADVIPAIAKELGAAAVVTDEAPTTPGRTWKADVGERLGLPMVAVDADVVVPSCHFPTVEWAPRTLRPKIGRLLESYLRPTPEPHAQHRSQTREAPDPFALVDNLRGLDRTVGPSPLMTGGQAAARKRLGQFCATHLATYEEDRNRADIDGSSRMSPYLHFGQISPLEIALTASAALGERAPEAKRSFLDELIVNRELCINFALRQPGYDTYAGCIPDWAKQTLAKHANDPRPHHYRRETLEHAKTSDALWNAAQGQMVHTGYMPNRLRMYWGKQVISWTRTPEEAFDTLVELNDRYFLCGRDAVGYAQIGWAIGGRHDRAFGPERPIIGLVRPMGMGAMKRTFDVNAYIAAIDEQYPDAEKVESPRLPGLDG